MKCLDPVGLFFSSVFRNQICDEWKGLSEEEKSAFRQHSLWPKIKDKLIECGVTEL